MKIITDEKKIEDVLKQFSEVKLAYFFGSRAIGEGGKMSDYDVAVYLDSQNVKENYRIKFSLMDKLSNVLKTDAVDVIVLDDVKKPALKYNIVKEGILLVDNDEYRVAVEPRIWNEYFDFRFNKFNNDTYDNN